MNDTTGKTVTCLAVAEKRPHRPGGCVGIFFQLFDWNRRFAKKKLFSRKLLPPARAKRTSKKFGGDEKMPRSKLHLIADENSGGFPNVKKNGSWTSVDMEQKHEMRAPSLVARLMGLESMPAVQRDKPKKASSSDNRDVREEKLVNDKSGCNRDDLRSDKGNGRLESRPQKIQKTGLSDRRAVARFGSEALQIKSVLSRTRKHHHQKLASPLKSPRMSSVKMHRASRLIDAATRILEPGLQATNRAKSALTYSSSQHHLSKKEVMSEPDLLKQSGYEVTAGNSLIGQAPCRNCGNLVDVVDSKPDTVEQGFVYSSPVSKSAGASSQEHVKNKPKPFITSLDQERNVILRKSWDQSSHIAVQKEDHLQSCSGSATERKPPSCEGQAQRHSTSQQVRTQKDEPLPSVFKHKNQAQLQISLGRERMPAKAKLSNLQSRRASSAANAVSEAKDFVALNRSLSGRTRPRMPTKVDPSNHDRERKSCNRQDDALSPIKTPVRKRRTITVNGQVESSSFGNSMLGKKPSARSEVVVGKEMGVDASTVRRTCTKSKACYLGEGNRVNGNENSSVISFTFNSPLADKSGTCTKLKERRKDQNDFTNKNASHQRKLMLDENDGKTSMWKQAPLDGDALGALLEQKLKELTSQEEDELTTGGILHKRSTAMILQELISALTAGQPVAQDGQVSKDIAFQTKAKTEGTSLGSAHDGDRRSPGSVLEAPFSNDSCFSSSADDISGHCLHFDSDSTHHRPRLAEPDSDLLDSATSSGRGRTSYEVVIDLVNQISRMLDRINHAHIGMSRCKVSHAKEVILNAELLFGKAAVHDSDEMRTFLVGPFLLDQLEILAGAMWANFDCLPGFKETKEGNQLREFLFECMTEYLDSKYSRYCSSGFKAWRTLPLYMNVEMLIQEVGEEVRRWTQFTGMSPDEIIEWEMSHSLGKWTDFEVEAFEFVAKIDWDILEILVEEVAMDLQECRLVSF